MVTVIVVAVGVTVCEVPPLIKSLLELLQPVPATSLLVAVTLLPVLKLNPDGAFNIIVPVLISAVTPSVITGPVRAVYVPPVVSADMAEPPVATVTVTAALAIAADKTMATDKTDSNNSFLSDRPFLIASNTRVIIGGVNNFDVYM